MLLDIKTLFVVNGALAMFMALSLLFYRVNYKTYRGYEFWLASTFAVTLIYLFILLRGVMPELLSVVLVNSVTALALILRLDGLVRFTRGSRLPRACYFLPILLIPLVAYFYLARDEITFRNLAVSLLALIFSSLSAWELFRNAGRDNKSLYLASGTLFASYGVLIFARAILWLMNRQDTLFQAGLEHQIYFLLATVLEVGTGISFLMMNSQRLEAELQAVSNDLLHSVADLEQALAEIKTLGGVLPICMHCKEIRDDRGYWNKLEKFISEHSEAQFSHSICEKCLEKYYPAGDPP